jgi:hypothetical protein
MKLSELITAVGDDNIIFQTLETDMHSANIFKSEGRVTFCTSPRMVADMLKSERQYTGLVVWIPNALMPPAAVTTEESQ